MTILYLFCIPLVPFLIFFTYAMITTSKSWKAKHAAEAKLASEQG